MALIGSRRRAVLLALCAAVVVAPAWAAPACAPLARLPLRDVGGTLLVPADLGGIAVSLVVDTGSDAGLIEGGVVRALGLRPAPSLLARLEGTGGGGREVPVALIPRLLLGSLAIRDVPMPVGALPFAPNVAPPVAGLLGADLLGRFALRIDVPDGRLDLLPDDGSCDASADAPARADAVPLGALGDRRTVRAMLDGHPVTALLDTGARSRIVSRRTAIAVGVSPSVLDAEPGGVASGVDGNGLIYHWHRFRSLAVGRDVERDPVLTVTPLPGSDSDMLLGADWFSRHRVLLSNRLHRMLVEDAAPR